MTCYRIADWEKFENAKSREIERCSWFAAPNRMTPKLVRLLKQPKGLAAFGLFRLLVCLASRHKLPRAGWLTDDGRAPGAGGNPLDLVDLARETYRAKGEVKVLLAILGAPEIGWIEDCAEAVEGSAVSAARIPEDPGKYPPRGRRGIRASILEKDSAVSLARIPGDIEVKDGKDVNDGKRLKEIGNGEAVAALDVDGVNPVSLPSNGDGKKAKKGGEGESRAAPSAPIPSPISTDNDTARWTTFAEFLRRSGWPEGHVRRILRWLLGHWEGVGARLSPGDWWRVMALCLHVGRNADKVTDPVSCIIHAFNKRQVPFERDLATAKAGWGAIEKESEREAPAWLAEMLAGVGAER